MGDTPIADAIHARTRGGIHEENYIDALQSVKDLERELASLRAEKDEAQKALVVIGREFAESCDRANRNHERAERADAERDEAIRMRDRHAEASKAQNEDITALMAERDAALKDAQELREFIASAFDAHPNLDLDIAARKGEQ